VAVANASADSKSAAVVLAMRPQRHVKPDKPQKAGTVTGARPAAPDGDRNGKQGADVAKSAKKMYNSLRRNIKREVNAQAAEVSVTVYPVTRAGMCLCFTYACMLSTACKIDPFLPSTHTHARAHTHTHTHMSTLVCLYTDRHAHIVPGTVFQLGEGDWRPA
jgi:hypothetical protein